MTAPRWRGQAAGAMTSRSFREAQTLGHGWCGVEHALLAVLDPPAATDAAAVLAELGLTRSEAEERLRDRWTAASGASGQGVTTNPAFESLIGTAQGMAMAFGADQLTDEHVLLALTYGEYGGLPPLLVSLGIDPDVLVRVLAMRGQQVPATLPPDIPPPVGPMGPRVYYAASDHPAVTRAMFERFPPGTAQWGFNVSKWKPGFHWIDAQESCNAEEIIRDAVSDTSGIEAIPIDVAAPEEASAAQQPYPR